MAFAFDQQARLATDRFNKIQSGLKLTLSDFQGEKLTFFEKSNPQFSKAIFLMETFYEDPSMFFEGIFESDPEIYYADFSDDESELGDFELSSVKTGFTEYIAVESLYEKFTTNFDGPIWFFEEPSKNDQKIENIDIHSDKLNFSSNFADFTFRNFVNGFCSKQLTKFLSLTRFDNFMSL